MGNPDISFAPPATIPEPIQSVEKNTDVLKDLSDVAEGQSTQPQDAFTPEVQEGVGPNPGDLISVLNLPDKKLQQPEEVPNVVRLKEALYENVANIPLSNAEKRELLKPESLTQLTTPEYIQLWKRLNPYFLSHVTRQGFRDHYAMTEHSRGLKEYQNGFLRIMQDDAIIRPPLALGELRSRDEDSVRKWLGDWVFQRDEQESLVHFNYFFNSYTANAPRYPDKSAVHFMAEAVGDSHYGAESKNEVFFIFPSDVIASQNAFAFNGFEKDLTRPQSEKKWNDVFVWPENPEDPGIQVNAGLVFLPQTTPVDPETGSKYASQIIVEEDGTQKRVLVEDQSVIGNYIKYFREVTGNQKHEITDLFNYYKSCKSLPIGQRYNLEEMERSLINSISKDLTQIGVPSDSASILAQSMMSEMHDLESETIDDEELTNAVKSSNALYVRAGNTIPAKQYWETFFEQHPESSPKHFVFYDGNPTQAVYDFLRDNGIGQANTATTEGKLLGFDDHYVEDMGTDPRANNGKAELRRMAEKIIKEHYNKE